MCQWNLCVLGPAYPSCFQLLRLQGLHVAIWLQLTKSPWYQWLKWEVFFLLMYVFQSWSALGLSPFQLISSLWCKVVPLFLTTGKNGERQPQRYIYQVPLTGESDTCVYTILTSMWSYHNSCSGRNWSTESWFGRPVPSSTSDFIYIKGSEEILGSKRHTLTPQRSVFLWNRPCFWDHLSSFPSPHPSSLTWIFDIEKIVFLPPSWAVRGCKCYWVTGQNTAR